MFPALNPGTIRAAILTVSPVCGLRPSRASLFLAEKVPNPTNVTFPSFFNPSVIPLTTASKALVASAFVKSAYSAIKSTNSVFVILNTSI